MTAAERSEIMRLVRREARQYVRDREQLAKNYAKAASYDEASMSHHMGRGALEMADRVEIILTATESESGT